MTPTLSELARRHYELLERQEQYMNEDGCAPLRLLLLDRYREQMRPYIGEYATELLGHFTYFLRAAHGQPWDVDAGYNKKGDPMGLDEAARCHRQMLTMSHYPELL